MIKMLKAAQERPLIARALVVLGMGIVALLSPSRAGARATSSCVICIYYPNDCQNTGVNCLQACGTIGSQCFPPGGSCPKESGGPEPTGLVICGRY